METKRKTVSLEIRGESKKLSELELYWYKKRDTISHRSVNPITKRIGEYKKTLQLSKPTDNELARSDNRQLGGKNPSQYKSKMTGDIGSILKSQYCSNALFDDDFEQFINLRSNLLLKISKNLCNIA